MRIGEGEMAIAFVFPGQGSQDVGMGAALAKSFPAARRVFEEVDEALGHKLSAVMWEGPLDSGLLLGSQALTTMSMPTGRLLLADFSRILMCEWGSGGLQIEVNPYANFQAGIRGVRAMISVDVGVLAVEAVSVSTTVT